MSTTRIRSVAKSAAADWSAIRDEIKRRVTCSAVCELAGLSQRGGRWPCPNPAHHGQQRGPDLTMNREDSGWRCHACAAGGSVFDLAVHVGAARDFADAVRVLAALAGVTLPAFSPTGFGLGNSAAGARGATNRRAESELEAAAALIPAERACEIRRRFAAVTQQHFTPDTAGAEYLAERHIPFDAARSAGCGWIADPTLADRVLREKYTPAELRAAGLIGKRGGFLGHRHRLTISDPNGGDGRALALRSIAPDAKPKEIACGRGVIGYTREMFDSATATVRAGDDSEGASEQLLIWCEGTTDWLTAFGLGLLAVCIPGAGQWKYAIDAIKRDRAEPTCLLRFNTRHVILFDGDAAGQSGAAALSIALRAECGVSESDVIIVAPSAIADSNCKDLSDCVRLGAGREEIESALRSMFRPHTSQSAE